MLSRLCQKKYGGEGVAENSRWVGGGEAEQDDVGSQSTGDWLPGIGRGCSFGIRKQSVRRDGVDDRLKPIAIVGAKIEMVAGIHRPQQQRNAPDISLRVVHADGQNGTVAFDDPPATPESLVVRALDRHLDQRRSEQRRL